MRDFGLDPEGGTGFGIVGFREPRVGGLVSAMAKVDPIRPTGW